MKLDDEAFDTLSSSRRKGYLAHENGFGFRLGMGKGEEEECGDEDSKNCVIKHLDE